MRVYMCLCQVVCVFKIFSETTGQIEAKYHVEPQWDRGEKFIQRIPVICCSSFEYCQPLGAGFFRGAFTTNVAPQCRAFLSIFLYVLTPEGDIRRVPGNQVLGVSLAGLWKLKS